MYSAGVIERFSNFDVSCFQTDAQEWPSDQFEFRAMIWLVFGAIKSASFWKPCLNEFWFLNTCIF